jgi:hypothetical protein
MGLLQRSEASYYSQGSPGGQVKTVFNQSESHPPRRAYAVFYGRKPGVYTQWSVFQSSCVAFLILPKARSSWGGSSSEGCPQRGVSKAQAAYEFAQRKTWTGVRGLPSPSLISHPPAISALPDPIPVNPLEPTANPLHRTAGPSGQQKWYIVYAGITPGIYLS